MNYPAPLIKAKLIKRDNRFCARVLLEDKEVKVHVPNSGRMNELMIEGSTVYIAPAPPGKPDRKTDFTMILATQEDTLVCIHSVKANDLFEEALKNGTVSDFSGYTVSAREKTVGKSRFDFILTNPEGKKVFTEVKSVSLVEERKALFPDAPTERGVKHLRELIRLSEDGFETAVVFIIQREDADTFSPHDIQHPEFGSTLREAVAASVKTAAYRCEIGLNEIKVLARVPVVL
ncbi:MAG: DNA/RNA nuclease SfsA [Firmicutes bacterium]|nr:DNA/RNA nuclease SfsA [Bacillota bacterium]